MRVLLLLVVLGLTGCGITTSARIRESTVETTSFVFRDMRPPEQRSSQVSRSEGAVTWATFADDNLAPSPPDLVRTALQRKLGETLASRTVTLSKFSLSVVDAANSRLLPRAPNAEELPEAVALGIVAIALLPLTVAAVGETSIQNRGEKVVTLEIKCQIDQESFSALVVDTYKGRATQGDITDTVRKGLAVLMIDAERAAKSAHVP